MIEAMLMVEETANCWTLSEAIGHRGPHVLGRPVPGGDVVADGVTDAWVAADEVTAAGKPGPRSATWPTAM